MRTRRQTLMHSRLPRKRLRTLPSPSSPLSTRAKHHQALNQTWMATPTTSCDLIQWIMELLESMAYLLSVMKILKSGCEGAICYYRKSPKDLLLSLIIGRILTISFIFCAYPISKENHCVSGKKYNKLESYEIVETFFYLS